MYRRTFTRLSLLSGGALLLPACGGRGDPLPSGAGVLGGEERKLIERFAEVYLPTEGTHLKALSEVPYVDNIDRRLSLFDPETREEVRLAMKLFNYGSIPIGLHFTSFVNLEHPERLAYIRRWDDGIGMQRGISTLMKNLVVNGYWQDVEASRSVEYRGPVSDDTQIANLGNASMLHAPPPRAG